MRNIRKVCLIFMVLLFTLFFAGTAEASEKKHTATGEEMVFISGGPYEKYVSGDNFVEVSVDSFYMSKHPVTQGSFERIMGTNPSRWQDDNKPVDSVTWGGAAKFCNELSRLEGLRPVYNEETWEMNPDANGYRLPTEAEWEYAARAGSDTKYFWGDHPGRLRFFAWYKENSDNRTRRVGRKMPNPYGLHDIYGNVAEWCYDYYEKNYSPEEKHNPLGPPEGEYRVVRGGSWNSPPENVSSFYRGREAPGYDDICTAAYDVYGFRIVRNAERD